MNKQTLNFSDARRLEELITCPLDKATKWLYQPAAFANCYNNHAANRSHA